MGDGWDRRWPEKGEIPLFDELFPNRVQGTPCLADFGPTWRKILAKRRQAFDESLRRYPAPPGVVSGEARFHFPTKSPRCDWIPNIWQPVHYGWQEFFAGPHQQYGGPPRMIVIYPSLTPFDPANPSSEILQGTYPLIAFAHGNCGTKQSGYNYDIYKSWIDTLAPLARAGYVVVIPKLPPVEIDVQKNEAEALTGKVSGAIAWVLHQSPFADNIDANKIGLAGHREGAYAAALLATGTDGVPKYPNVRAYASLSGTFLYRGGVEHPMGDGKNPNWYLDELRNLPVPYLFMIGAQGTSGEAGAPDDNSSHVNDIGIFDWDGMGRDPTMASFDRATGIHSKCEKIVRAEDIAVVSAVVFNAAHERKRKRKASLGIRRLEVGT